MVEGSASVGPHPAMRYFFGERAKVAPHLRPLVTSDLESLDFINPSYGAPEFLVQCYRRAARLTEWSIQAHQKAESSPDGVLRDPLVIARTKLILEELAKMFSSESSLDSYRPPALAIVDPPNSRVIGAVGLFPLYQGSKERYATVMVNEADQHENMGTTGSYEGLELVFLGPELDPQKIYALKRPGDDAAAKMLDKFSFTNRVLSEGEMYPEAGEAEKVLTREDWIVAREGFTVPDQGVHESS